MKRIFAIAMTIILLISCFAIAISADAEPDAETPNDEGEKTYVTPGYLKVDVWGTEIDTWLAETTSGTYWTDEFWGAANTELLPGQTVYAKTVKKQFLAKWATGFDKTKQMAPKFTCKFAGAYDISQMKYVVWDFYMTDASILDCWFTVDLSSSASVSSEFCRARTKLSGYATETGNGWYRVELPLELLKQSGNKTELDKTKCNFFSFCFDDPTEFTHGEEDFTFAIRSLGFSEVKAAEWETFDGVVETILALYAPLASIKKGDITADNYETVKSQLAEAKAEYKDASEDIQAKVRETYNVLTIGATVEAALRQYEDSLNTKTQETTAAPGSEATPGSTAAPGSTTDSTDQEENPEKVGCESSVSAVLLPFVLIAVLGVAALGGKYRKMNKEN